MLTGLLKTEIGMKQDVFLTNYLDGDLRTSLAKKQFKMYRKGG